MTASEAKEQLVMFQGTYEAPSYESVGKAIEALDLLEKVESMEFLEEWYEDEKSAYERGYNACLREIKGDTDASK